MTKELQIDLRAILSREDEVWLAHCLEMDIVAEGNTPREAVQDLIDLCTFQIETAIEHHDLASVFRPAPPEVWIQFFSSKKKKQLRHHKGPVKTVEGRELELI